VDFFHFLNLLFFAEDGALDTAGVVVPVGTVKVLLPPADVETAVEDSTDCVDCVEVRRDGNTRANLPLGLGDGNGCGTSTRGGC
jgi:hypothetical protein